MPSAMEPPRSGCASSATAASRSARSLADGSSTSPHLRRAAATDEGGPGLVAQFTEQWGTRYMPRGMIWTEQSPHSTATEPDADMAGVLLDQWGDADW
jgi:hypothetical protein